MIKIAEYSPGEVFPFVPNDCRESVKEFFGGYNVKVSSPRLVLFKRNKSCVCCGITGNKIVLETHDVSQTPHFNMYACVDGDMVLMTKDHIIPVAGGGKNILSNYQTMCQTCNHIKDDYNFTLDDLKKVRKSYDKLVEEGIPRKMAWKRALNLRDNYD